ncbi:hypothetical protein BT69DRAFT_537175 [Atractiella rhizophila]|nr:hypothetical protein BT69DRAFT_537175 [Atractiella rhizophila]
MVSLCSSKQNGSDMSLMQHALRRSMDIYSLIVRPSSGSCIIHLTHAANGCRHNNQSSPFNETSAHECRTVNK